MRLFFITFVFFYFFISPFAHAGGLDIALTCRTGEWEIFISPFFGPPTRSVSISFSHPTKSHEELYFDDASSLIDSNGDRALFGQIIGKATYSLWGANAEAKYRRFSVRARNIALTSTDCTP